jgi:hypothetical protein
MLYAAFKAIARMLSICAVFSGVLSHALCSVDEVVVNGRIDDPPKGETVRVQLVYPNQQMGESGEITPAGSSFRIQIPFLTQSHPPTLIGSLREKCNRRPKTVIVTLVKADQEYDRVSLDLAKDFKMADSSSYALLSEILLHRPPRTPPIR